MYSAPITYLYLNKTLYADTMKQVRYGCVSPAMEFGWQLWKIKIHGGLYVWLYNPVIMLLLGIVIFYNVISHQVSSLLPKLPPTLFSSIIGRL